MITRTSRLPSFSTVLLVADIATDTIDAAPSEPRALRPVGPVRKSQQATQICARLFRRALAQPHRPVQRPLLDGEQAAKRNRDADCGGDVDPMKGRRHIA